MDGILQGLTASTREKLASLKDAADESGYAGVSDQLADDMATLDALDAELAALLKRRQNGYFSDADQIRLQELIDTREAIEVKYRLSPADADGFDTIRQKLEAEVARAQARGKQDADVTVYENAVVAAAQGLAAMNAEIDAQYDKEYALIQLIEDSTERQNAMEALNAKYNENRRDAALEYAALLSDVVPKVWAQADIQQAASDVDTLTQKLREYSAAGESRKARPAGRPERHRRGHGRGRDDRIPRHAHADPVPFGQRPVGERDSGHVPGDRLHHGAGADRRHPDVPE